ncbi:MAG: ribonuclease E inhibitor RraB [Gammaproteobacteria bacterium]
MDAADTNGELLRLMQEQGDDLTAPRDVDFFVIFETRAQAEAFAEAATVALGMPAQVSPYEKTDKWQLVLTRHMPPDHALLNSLEKQIAGLARQHGGDADGWGCPQAGEEAGLR